MNPLLAISQTNSNRATRLTYDTWDPETVTEPTYSSLADGQYFWYNPQGAGVRSSQHWSGLNYSIETVSGRKRFTFSVNPRVPDVSGAGHFNYRGEISFGWTTGSALLTRECVGMGYIVPAGGLKTRVHEMAIDQWHCGTAPGGPYPDNEPVIYLGLAYAGQQDVDHDPAELNELVVVRKAAGFDDGNSGRKNTGVVFNDGDRIELYHDLISGRGDDGRFILKVRKMPSGGSWGAWMTVFDELGSTAWANDADGGSNSMVHPDWKGGVYAFGIKSLSGVEADEAVNGGIGTYDIKLHTPYIKRKKMLLGDPFYNSDILNDLDTSNIP